MMRSLFAIPTSLAHTAACGILALATSRVRPSAHEPIVQLWSRGINRFCGVRLSVGGAERLDPGQRYVFISNHQSLLDITCLAEAIPNPLRFVAKRELRRIPLFGAAMQAVGTVVINRADRQQALASLAKAQQGIARTFSLLFFAEGTRSPDGTLRPFKKGGVATAQTLGLPLVPVAVAGTRDILRKGALLSMRAGPVRVEIGQPIPVQGESAEEREALLAKLQEEVARLLEQARAALR